MKTLNLDTLAKSNRTITIGGKEHEVVEMTVENFIETTRAAERLEGSTSMVEQVEETIKMILRSVPTLDAPTLRKLKLEQLTTVIRFIRGDLDEAKKESAEGGDAKKA